MFLFQGDDILDMLLDETRRWQIHYESTLVAKLKAINKPPPRVQQNNDVDRLISDLTERLESIKTKVLDGAYGRKL